MSEFKGYVYILTNQTFDFLKIGYSKKGGVSRAKELSKDTGVPTPYKCAYHLEVADAQAVESAVHLELKEYRQGRKEFFDCGIDVAISSIESNQDKKEVRPELKEKKHTIAKPEGCYCHGKKCCGLDFCRDGQCLICNYYDQDLSKFTNETSLPPLIFPDKLNENQVNRIPGYMYSGGGFGTDMSRKLFFICYEYAIKGNAITESQPSTKDIWTLRAYSAVHKFEDGGIYPSHVALDWFYRVLPYVVFLAPIDGHMEVYA